MSSPWRNAFIQASAKAVAWAAHFGQASADQPATWVRLAMPAGIPGIGVSWNGESPIAGWFIIENPSINGWFAGAPIFGNPHMFTIKYYSCFCGCSCCLGEKPNARLSFSFPGHVHLHRARPLRCRLLRWKWGGVGCGGATFRVTCHQWRLRFWFFGLKPGFRNVEAQHGIPMVES